jgi:peroxiredoxin
VGELAPDFELQATNGEMVRLSHKRGRIAVFMFVAMTCPPNRTQVDLWFTQKMMPELADVTIAVDPIDEHTLKDYGIVPVYTDNTGKWSPNPDIREWSEL